MRPNTFLNNGCLLFDLHQSSKKTGRYNRYIYSSGTAAKSNTDLRERFMELFAELFKSPVGILSLITIVVIIMIATYLFFWVKKQVEKDGK